MERTRYDLTARRVARLDPVGFFCWLLTEFARSLRFVGWLDPRSTPEGTNPETIGDTVARLEQIQEVAPPWLFPVEFQTTPDPKMFGRLQVQIGQWWIDLRPDDLPDSRFQVSSGVVNLTGTRESAPASRLYHFPTPDGLNWGGKVCERYLAEESADQTMTRLERDELSRCLLPLIVLMQGGGESGIIRRWRALASQILDSRLRADLGSLALALAALKDWFPLWKDALKEWNMLESPFVLDLQREATIKAKIEDLKVFLESRFGELPADLLRRIEVLTDLNRVDQLVRAAGRVNRPEELPL
jgi:hypothetical protein